MKAGIVGIPNVGKSTLFNALTDAGAAASNYPFCTIEPNTGIVQVPDGRLDSLNKFIETEKVIPAVLQLVDIAGLVKGASKGEGLGNKFLSHIREVDAILHVVRCFENPDVTHVDGDTNPVRDVDVIETELMLADLELVESAITKAQKLTRGGDKEAILRVSVLERCRDILREGKPVRSLEWKSEDERTMLKGMGLISAKKVLYVANVDEDTIAGDNEHVGALSAFVESNGGQMVRVCAKIEAELMELEPDERMEMLKDLGMEEPALHAVARAAYQLLGLQSYFTAGPKEIRAWTVPVGATAPQAAGVIHTDFERGFIRAEVYQIGDLEELTSETAIKAAGRMRLEGKDYVMADGDVCHFLFNV